MRQSDRRRSRRASCDASRARRQDATSFRTRACRLRQVASVSSSDIRDEALDAFVADSIAMTRSLAKDPFRSLPDPSLYEGQAGKDLQLADPAYAGVTAADRRHAAQRIEEAARSVLGADAILSVTTGFNDNRTESFRVHSNGFAGSRIETSFWTYAEVHVRDADGRRPEEWSANGVRFASELPDVDGVKLHVTLLRPHSRGSLSLRSADPAAAPPEHSHCSRTDRVGRATRRQSQ